MNCERKGCEKPVSNYEVRRGGRFCSQICARAVRFNQPLAVAPAEYRMRCYECGKWYDGRKGVEIGLCSETCQAAHESTRRVARAREAQAWRRVGPLRAAS